MEEEIQIQKTFKQKIDEVLNKYRLYIAAFAILFIVFSGTVLIVQGADANKSDIKIIKSDELVQEQKDATQEVKAEEIVFDIEGAVINPGVYKLPVGSVMDDGIKTAGGLSVEADIDRISRELNRASPIGNNAKMYLFKKSDKDFKLIVDNNSSGGSSGSTSNNPNSGVGVKINVNTADLTVLDSLPGIGPAIGQRIIDWRDANGGYEVIEDLKKVKGIGDSLFEGVKDLITVE